MMSMLSVGVFAAVEDPAGRRGNHELMIFLEKNCLVGGAWTNARMATRRKQMQMNAKAIDVPS